MTYGLEKQLNIFWNEYKGFILIEAISSQSSEHMSHCMDRASMARVLEVKSRSEDIGRVILGTWEIAPISLSSKRK